MKKIAYIEKLEGINYDRIYQANLKYLMQMGTYDFEKNLEVLMKN
jgi:hypothetical protein